MALNKLLTQRGIILLEGYSQQVDGQVNDLIQLTSTPNINVMEIGFHAGHSAEVFLKNNPSLNLISFDIGHHPCVSVGKEYIDATYPDRHKLIVGDSLITVPTFIQNNPNKKFDVIFIDGGHSHSVATGDIQNCKKLAHKDTIVIMDDTIFTPKFVQAWNIGPTQTWREHVNYGQVSQLATKDYDNGRGMSWGKYNF
jgi:predicted O-methyltransferase YrrM